MNPTIKPIRFSESKDGISVSAFVGDVSVAYAVKQPEGFEITYHFPVGKDGKDGFYDIETAKYLIGFMWEAFIMKISHTQVSGEVADSPRLGG